MNRGTHLKPARSPKSPPTSGLFLLLPKAGLRYLLILKTPDRTADRLATRIAEHLSIARKDDADPGTATGLGRRPQVAVAGTIVEETRNAVAR